MTGSFDTSLASVVDDVVANRLAEAKKRWQLLPEAQTSMEEKQRALLAELIDNAANLQPALVEILALSIFANARPDVSAFRVYVAANPRSSATARQVLRRRGKQLALFIGDALEPPASVSFDELVSIVLQLLYDNRPAEAKARWDGQTDTHRRDSPTYPLVNELVRVARYLQPPFVQTLVGAIRGGTPLASAIVKALGVLVLAMPDRIRYEIGILERLAPTLAELVHDGLRRGASDDPFPPSHEVRTRGPSRLVLYGVFVGVLGALAVPLIFILRPGSIERRNERRNERLAPTPAAETSSRTNIEAPLPDNDQETNALALFAVRRSVDILAKHGWMKNANVFASMTDALKAEDCALAIENQRVLALTRTAPDAAHDHVDAIQRRVVRICQSSMRSIAPTR